MIQYVEVTNHIGDIYRLDIKEESKKKGMVITNIDGIGPANANINLTDVADSDEKFFNSAFLDSRNITMNLLFFNEFMTIEEARHLSYLIFPPKYRIHLSFKTDKRLVGIDGYVESNEPSIFNKEEEANVSIICEDPFFYDEDNAYDEAIRKDAAYGIIKKFHFPFSANKEGSLNGKRLPIVFGHAQKYFSKLVNFPGEYAVGLDFIIKVKKEAKHISLRNITTDKQMILNTDNLSEIISGSTSFLAGDEIYINTRRGKKGITLLRNGDFYNILHTLQPGSAWIEFIPGYNQMSYTAEEGYTDIEVRYYYKTSYIGV